MKLHVRDLRNKIVEALGEPTPVAEPAHPVDQLLDAMSDVVHGDGTAAEQAITVLLDDMGLSFYTPQFISDLRQLADTYSEASSSPADNNPGDWAEAETRLNAVLAEIDDDLTVDDAHLYFPIEQWEEGMEGEEDEEDEVE